MPPNQLRKRPLRALLGVIQQKLSIRLRHTSQPCNVRRSFGYNRATMQRRQFLQLVAASALGGCVSPGRLSSTTQLSAPAHTAFDHYFLKILDGFLRNTEK